MMTDIQYNKLYKTPPSTSKGRAARVVLLIRHRLARSRAFDDCFESGDGTQVLALLLQNVHACPELRRMMIEQRVWSPEFDAMLLSESFQDERQLALI